MENGENGLFPSSTCCFPPLPLFGHVHVHSAQAPPPPSPRLEMGREQGTQWKKGRLPKKEEKKRWCPLDAFHLGSRAWKTVSSKGICLTPSCWRKTIVAAWDAWFMVYTFCFRVYYMRSCKATMFKTNVHWPCKGYVACGKNTISITLSTNYPVMITGEWGHHWSQTRKCPPCLYCTPIHTICTRTVIAADHHHLKEYLLFAKLPLISPWRPIPTLKQI